MESSKTGWTDQRWKIRQKVPKGGGGVDCLGHNVKESSREMEVVHNVIGG